MNIVSGIFRFYLDGFRRMTLGKTLWAIVLIKLFVMFAIVKVFLLPDYLGSRCETREEKSALVAENLTAGVDAVADSGDPWQRAPARGDACQPETTGDDDKN